MDPTKLYSATNEEPLLTPGPSEEVRGIRRGAAPWESTKKALTGNQSAKMMAEPLPAKLRRRSQIIAIEFTEV